MNCKLLYTIIHLKLKKSISQLMDAKSDYDFMEETIVDNLRKLVHGTTKIV